MGRLILLLLFVTVREEKMENICVRDILFEEIQLDPHVLRHILFVFRRDDPSLIEAIFVITMQFSKIRLIVKNIQHWNFSWCVHVEHTQTFNHTCRGLQNSNAMHSRDFMSWSQVHQMSLKGLSRPPTTHHKTMTMDHIKEPLTPLGS